jgi:hypothetical protein
METAPVENAYREQVIITNITQLSTLIGDEQGRKKKRSSVGLYSWALLFFGLSSLLPNAAILSDMDYFMSKVS